MHSPLEAYRRDVRATPIIPPSDEALLRAATELRLAATLRGAQRRQYLYSAIGNAIDVLGDEFIDSRSHREWPRDLGYVEAVMILAEVIQDQDALHLAAVILDDLLTAATDITPLVRGRILTQRARVAWKLGELQDAAERYRFIASLGRRAREPELLARSALGMTALAQQRGNYPEMREHAERAFSLAREHAIASVERLARYALMVLAARREDHDEALSQGWCVLELSRDECDWEAEALQSLGQLLLDMGEVNVARACFAAVMNRVSTARVLLPALGGLARSSALTEREATVEWAVREVWRVRAASLPTYAVASALLECSDALELLGRTDEAQRYRDFSASLAALRGFHELVHLEKQSRIQAVRVQHSASAHASPILRSLARYEPEQLPDSVTFDGAPV